MANIIIETGGVLKSVVFPDPKLNVGLAIIMTLDLVTGIQKSNHLKVASSSVGLKKSIKKAITYLSLIVLVWVIVNMTLISSEDLGAFPLFTLTGIYTVLIHWEVKSVLENLIIAQDKNSDTRSILVIVHNVWILKLKKMDEFNYVETKEMLENKLNK